MRGVAFCIVKVRCCVSPVDFDNAIFGIVGIAMRAVVEQVSGGVIGIAVHSIIAA